MPPIKTHLRQLLSEGGDLGRRAIHGRYGSVGLGLMRAGTSLDAPLATIAGRSLLLATADQTAAGLALIELDGAAARIVICPPDLKAEQIGTVVADAALDAIVTDRDPAEFAASGLETIVRCGLPVAPAKPGRPDDALVRHYATEWVMLTSGTTGRPKMVVHSLAGLSGAMRPGPLEGETTPPVWGTFYDIRRYGGLQIFLRALFGTGSLVLSSAGEEVAQHLERLAVHGVTHQTGTPSHWRRVLMCPEAKRIDPAYVRLSGEIADQAVLDNLRRTYPRAAIGHAYASTEAGVGFEVTDGLEGFPAALLGRPGPLAMKIEDGSLRIRSDRTATRYIGAAAPALSAADGFIDTDDMVEQRGDRLYFVGRRSGIINVGGLKVHPEEVEAVINRHDRVRMSLVRGKINPITGSIVVADVVLNDEAAREGADPAVVKAEILQMCRSELPQHKVPVLVRFLPKLDVTPAGKLARPYA